LSIFAGSGLVLARCWWRSRQRDQAHAGVAPRDGGDQVWQETADLAERDRDEAAAKARGDSDYRSPAPAAPRLTEVLIELPARLTYRPEAHAAEKMSKLV
jgi:hypothetical protein